MVFNRNTFDFWDIVSYILAIAVMIFIVIRLATVGAFIDILFLLVYYEICLYTKDLAEDIEEKNQSFEKRIRELEEKNRQ